jgi:hypothetical protein
MKHLRKNKPEIIEDVEVIRSKKQHNFDDLVEVPFEMIDYTKNQDKKLIEYRKQEIQLLSQILKELQKLTSSDAKKV